MDIEAVRKQGQGPAMAHPCVAADSALACKHEAAYFVVTATGTCFVCERHRRLIEIKLEREGLSPRVVRLPDAATALPAQRA